jgi:pSer/pThr/pTyr-binding forkhead associated (FHA) protein
VRFDDPEEFLSRVHAELQVSESSATLRDRDSANGTFVNDRPATGETLAVGDTVRLGKLELTYRGPIGSGPALGD